MLYVVPRTGFHFSSSQDHKLMKRLAVLSIVVFGLGCVAIDNLQLEQEDIVKVLKRVESGSRVFAGREGPSKRKKVC